MIVDNAFRMLIHDEGMRSHPYRDSLGNLTIGVGHNLADGLSGDVIRMILLEDIIEAEDAARSIFPDWKELSDNRQLAIVNLIFNLGKAGFMEWRKTIHAIKDNDFERAASLVENAQPYASQVGSRAHRVASLLRNQSEVYG